MKKVLFVSYRFLFPTDSGGTIRSTQVLRGLKALGYRITLVSPATRAQETKFDSDLAGVADEWIAWPQPTGKRLFSHGRASRLLTQLPERIATDWSALGSAVVHWAMRQRPDVAVFDFLSSAMYLPPSCDVPAVLFTHNVEAEIARRCEVYVADELLRQRWGAESRRLESYERAALAQFEAVLTVSVRDRDHFRSLGLQRVFDIRNGVDLEQYEYSPPIEGGCILFVGSMDWIANQDAMTYWFEEIWPIVKLEQPRARMFVVGRNPPHELLSLSKRWPDVEVTGSVVDVRPYLKQASVSVLPFRIGGGTRMKAYESMAAGVPLVSTSIGIEGLPVTAGRHYLLANEPEVFAQHVLRLLREPALRNSLSHAARAHVEAEGSYRNTVSDVARICHWAIDRAGRSARARGSQE